jgi:putative endonuclease
MAKRGYVYILASRKHGTLYTGVTSNLGARVYQHKQGTGSAFTRRYNVHRLVYFEEFELVTDAIRRENTIKGWPRAVEDTNDRSGQSRLEGFDAGDVDGLTSPSSRSARGKRIGCPQPSERARGQGKCGHDGDCGKGRARAHSILLASDLSPPVMAVLVTAIQSNARQVCWSHRRRLGQAKRRPNTIQGRP